MPITFPSNPTQNQTYTDTNGRAWRYNGRGWTRTASGSIGATGATGIQGNIGLTGATGAAGSSAAIYDVVTSSEGYFDLPSGNTAQRPNNPPTGAIRYNSTTGSAEVYVSAGWVPFGQQPPSISSVSPATYNGESGTVFTINGANFTFDAIVRFVDNAGIEYTAGTVVYVNASQLTATTPQDFTVAQEPLDVKVIQSSGVATRTDCIDCGGTPTWITAAGTIATINDVGGNYNPIATLVATDPDAGATIAYSLLSGSLPAGTSLNTSNGQITGDPTNVVSQTTSNFTVRASDNAGNTSDRAFSIIVNPGLDGSSSSRAAASAEAIKSLTGTTTNGTYWINIGGTPTEIYCDMVTDGGGWMSFAAMTGSGSMWSGSTGSTSWATTSYSLGTYDKAGGTASNYWRNISGQTKTSVLFKTGNGTYWIRMLLSQVYSSVTHTTNIATSNNFPSDSNNYNGSITVLYRGDGNPEDPWINAGNTHSGGNNYMFWGENSSPVHYTFKNNNNGVIAFIK